MLFKYMRKLAYNSKLVSKYKIYWPLAATVFYFCSEYK